MKDLKNNVAPVRVISPVSPSATGTITGQIIDMQGFNSLMFVASAGAQTTAGITVTPVVLAGSATGALASAPDTDLIGTEAAVAAELAGAGGANGVGKIGYKGSNRYVRCDLIVTAAATGVYCVNAIKGHPNKAPV